MSDPAILAIAWLGFALHAVVGLIAWRGRSSLPLLALLNLATAACVLAYWGQRWYGYLFRGITWYATDQLIPLYFVCIAILAGVTLSGRAPAVVAHWVVFTIDAVWLLAAALFFSFFRINRLF